MPDQPTTTPATTLNQIREHTASLMLTAARDIDDLRLRSHLHNAALPIDHDTIQGAREQIQTATINVDWPDHDGTVSFGYARPVPSFADRLTTTEHAKLHTRVAQAEGDRDNALDDLRSTRADRDRLDALYTQAVDHNTTLQDDHDRLDALLRETDADATRYRQQREAVTVLLDRANGRLDYIHRELTSTSATRDRYRDQADRLNAERQTLAQELADQANTMASLRTRLDALHRRFIAAAPVADLAHRQIRAIRTLVDPHREPHATKPIDFTVLAAEIGAILDDDAGLGSSRRAQEATGAADPEWTAIVARIEREVSSESRESAADVVMDAYLLGLDRGVARSSAHAGWALDLVRGLVRFEAEHPMFHAQFAGSPSFQPAECPAKLLDLVPADVMEAVRAQDSYPAVNTEETHDAAARRFAGELERLSAGMLERDIQPEPTDPVATATVDTALRALDRFLTVVNAATQWRTGWADDAAQTMPHSQIRDLVVAVDGLLASWPGMDLSVPAVSIAEVAAEGRGLAVPHGELGPEVVKLADADRDATLAQIDTDARQLVADIAAGTVQDEMGEVRNR